MICATCNGSFRRCLHHNSQDTIVELKSLNGFVHTAFSAPLKYDILMSGCSAPTIAGGGNY